MIKNQPESIIFQMKQSVEYRFSLYRKPHIKNKTKTKNNASPTHKKPSFTYICYYYGLSYLLGLFTACYQNKFVLFLMEYSNFDNIFPLPKICIPQHECDKVKLSISLCHNSFIPTRVINLLALNFQPALHQVSIFISF